MKAQIMALPLTALLLAGCSSGVSSNELVVQCKEEVRQRLKDQALTKVTLRDELYQGQKIQDSILTEEKLVDWVKRQNFFHTEQ